MLKYIKGIFKNLFNPGVTLLTKIDDRSKVSRKSHIWAFCQVTNSTVGDYTYVGRKSRVIYADIGKFCSIAGDCSVGMGTHTFNHISTSSIFTAKRNGTKQSWVDTTLVEEFKRVTIGNDVWIGANVMVIGGVTIGDGAVIGAGAVVTKDIPPYGVVGGVPAKLIRYRFDDNTIAKLLQLKWWDLSCDILKANIESFQNIVNEPEIDNLLRLTIKNNRYV